MIVYTELLDMLNCQQFHFDNFLLVGMALRPCEYDNKGCSRLQYPLIESTQ